MIFSFYKIREIESENQELRIRLDQMLNDHEMEKAGLRENFESRLSLIRENSKRQLQDEKELLNEHIELLEKGRHEMMQQHRKKYDELQKECNAEIERLKEVQKRAIDNLKSEHDEIVKRIRELKDNEVDAALAASAHTRTIENVLTSIQENTKNIDTLSQKVQINHIMNLSEREVELRTKEENLKCNNFNNNKKFN